jgi:DNA-binding winged helix-turn-helix (wHTH) protein/Tfp pilus assembly protein PilF
MRLQFGDCLFDAESRTLQRGGSAVRITAKAFQLLELLLAARPKPIAKEELFARLWPDTFVSDGNLATLIREIRAATGDDARQPRYIRTVHRFGYAFSGDVSAVPERAPLDSARRPRKRYVENAEVYQLYLKGRHHWNRRTAEGIERAIVCFESAIESDAAYAPAYSGLADCAVALASRDLHPPRQLFPKAEAAARRALALDPELAEAHASLAAIEEVFHWRWQEAEREYLEALRLNPAYATARQWYAMALAHHGRFTEGLTQMARVAESDPLSFMLNANIAVIHYLAGEWEAGEESCRKALEINPHHEPAHFTLGLIFQQCGRFDEARAELERALAISRGEPHVVAALGALDVQHARRHLAHLAELSISRYVSPVHPATIHAALGENDLAFAELDRAVSERSGWLVYLPTEPRFAGIRADPRFAALLSGLSLRA